MIKAIGYQQSLPVTNTDALQDITLPMPEASGHDILVEIDAISVNPADPKIRMAVQPENDEWKILGWDAVGTVKAIGDKVTTMKVGERVWYAGDVSRSGSYTQFQLVDERIVGHAPQSLSNAEAAALPLTSLTAWEMLFDRLEVSTDKNAEKKSMMIIGAAGGVGSIMVQLANKLTNLNIIGTASRPETTQWLQKLGADHVINHRNPLSEELKAIGIDEVDYVVSLNNTEDHYPEIIKSVKPQGKFGLIDDPSSLDAMALKTKSISLHWELMFTRSLFNTDDMQAQQEILNKIASLIDSGEIITTLGENFGQINAENVLKAHALIESQKAKGKIVLEGF